jgi:hypothetical protein
MVLARCCDGLTRVPAPGPLIDIRRWRLHINCPGKPNASQPTVILEAGAGDFSGGVESCTACGGADCPSLSCTCCLKQPMSGLRTCWSGITVAARWCVCNESSIRGCRGMGIHLNSTPR